MQRLTIPKRVQLPFGYVVTIKQVTDSEMEEIVEDGTGESVDGYWDPDERVLYIRKSLPIRRRRTSSPTNSVMPGTTGSTTRWIMGLPLAINSPA